MSTPAFQTASPLRSPLSQRRPSTHSPRRPKRRPTFRACAPTDDTPPFEALFLKGPVPGDRIVRTISATGEVSCRVVSCTGLVSGATRLHRTTPVASTAFGRALTCALLLSAGKKDGETLQLEFRGSGPIKGITAISNGAGEVRGYVGNSAVSVPLRNGRVDVSAAIGKGVLAVVRNTPFSKQPYTGLVQISSGEVAEDLAKYLAESEQTPSALGAGIYLGEGGAVTAAGGYLVQLLPGASERTAEIVERNVRAIGTPTELVRAGCTPDEIVDSLMKDLSPIKVASVSPRYCCHCGVDRVKRTVALIPELEVRQLLQDQGKIEGKLTVRVCSELGALFRFPLTVAAEMLTRVPLPLPFSACFPVCANDARLRSEQLLASFAGRCTHCCQKKLSKSLRPDKNDPAGPLYSINRPPFAIYTAPTHQTTPPSPPPRPL